MATVSRFIDRPSPRAHQAEERIVRVYVWQIPVRISHWLIVLSIAVLSFTGFYLYDPFIISRASRAFLFAKSCSFTSLPASLSSPLFYCACTGSFGETNGPAGVSFCLSVEISGTISSSNLILLVPAAPTGFPSWPQPTRRRHLFRRFSFDVFGDPYRAYAVKPGSHD